MTADTVTGDTAPGDTTPGGTAAGPIAVPAPGASLTTAYDQLREWGPVHQVVLPDGSHAWLVTGHQDVLEALASPKLSLDKRHSHHWSGFSLPPALDANLLNMDPPDHTRIRRLVSQAFTPSRVASLRPVIATIANSLLDAMLTGDSAGGAIAGRRADLVEDYAAPLSVAVISDLLGVPAADRGDFRSWTNTMLTAFPPDRRAAAEAVGATHRYVLDLVARKRRQPGDDLISALTAARDAQDRLSEDELTSLVFLILFAGYENTINLISNTVLLLLTEDIPAGTPASAAVEESLRLLPPAPVAIRRFPIDDITIAGTDIPAGATVLLAIAAANRDPAAFPDPSTMDVTRERNPHLSLGHGIHYCLGAPLARVEGQIAVEALFQRVPDLALAAPVTTLTWRPSFRTLGPLHLPLTW